MSTKGITHSLNLPYLHFIYTLFILYYIIPIHSTPTISNYNVSIVLRDTVPNGSSLISRINGTSPDFNYTFATAWFIPPPSSLPTIPNTHATTYTDGLIVRVVECNANHHSCAGVAHPEWTNAGALAIIGANLNISSSVYPTTEIITLNNISWVGTNPPPHGGTTALWGAADPRISHSSNTGMYYLTWDNCTENCYPHRTTMLSTTNDPFNYSSWIFRGPLLGENPPYSAGASLILRSTPPHYAFISNSDTANIINLAVTNDINGYTGWTLNTTSTNPWMAGRPGMWDSSGVATGAQPELLSTGDYLFIYNIDTGFPYHPSYLGRCSIGWAILDGTDPSKIIARAAVPLLTPQLAWETCGGESGKGPWPMCQEPEVVFSTGMKPLGNDRFLLLYGAADSYVGAVEIVVTFTEDGRDGKE